jgi:Fic family protein
LERNAVRGRWISVRWDHDPTTYAPPRYRKACEYEAFLPDPLTTLRPVEMAVAGTVSHAEEAIRRLNEFAHPALTPLARLLLRTEAIASSKIEGMQADARTLARAEARADTGSSVGREVAEILRNIDAMQLAVEIASDADTLTVDHVLDIHRSMLASAPNADRIVGVFRDRQNWIGGNDYNPCGAAYVPPPPEKVDDLMGDLLVFLNDESLPPLAQAAFAHAQFELIHPFADGNGRTGRALVQVLLRRRGIAPRYVPPVSVILASDKDAYIKGLVAFRDGQEEAWLESFAVAATRSAELAGSYLQRVEHLQSGWRTSAAHVVKRRDAGAWSVIDQLPAHPSVSLPVLSALTGRTRPAVSHAVDQLVEAGVLAPLSSGNRNRRWEASGLLDLLAGLESARG